MCQGRRPLRHLRFTPRTSDDTFASRRNFVSPPKARLRGMFNRIDHIGVAVEDIEESLALYRDAFGMEVAHREIVEEQGVEAVLLDVGENHVELLAPLGPDTPVGKFLAKRGAGLHHVAYQVSDIEAALAALQDAGQPLIDKVPRVGIRGALVAFLEPKGTARVLTELVQPVEDH
jgi:methylmalonyl-CoA/ethylmalonyl-CoA epimerase